MILLIFTATIVSLLASWLISFKFKSVHVIKNNYIAINTIFVYVMILVFTSAYDMYLELELYSYDINNDGVFSADEQTIEQKVALSKVANDTARNIIPITAVFYTIIYGIFLIACRKMLSYSRNKK